MSSRGCTTIASMAPAIPPAHARMLCDADDDIVSFLYDTSKTLIMTLDEQPNLFSLESKLPEPAKIEASFLISLLSKGIVDGIVGDGGRGLGEGVGESSAQTDDGRTQKPQRTTTDTSVQSNSQG